MTCWIRSPFDWRSHDPVGGPPEPGGAAVAVGAMASELAIRTEVASATSLRWKVLPGGFERVDTITSPFLLRRPRRTGSHPLVGAGIRAVCVEPAGTSLGSRR